MDGVHQNTLTILRSLLHKYELSSKAMKSVTFHLLSNINTAYRKFVRADQMHKVIKDHSAEMIVVQLLRRVK